MAKQKSHLVQEHGTNEMVIEINPFEIDKKIRRISAPPTKYHKDKSKYSRKQKFKKQQIDE